MSQFGIIDFRSSPDNLIALRELLQSYRYEDEYADKLGIRKDQFTQFLYWKANVLVSKEEVFAIKNKEVLHSVFGIIPDQKLSEAIGKRIFHFQLYYNSSANTKAHYHEMMTFLENRYPINHLRCRLARLDQNNINHFLEDGFIVTAETIKYVNRQAGSLTITPFEDILVRLAQESDWDDLKRMISEHNYNEKLIAYSHHRKKVMWLLQNWLENRALTARTLVAIVKSTGKIAGVCMYTISNVFKVIEKGPVIALDFIMVKEEYRRLKVAKCLMDEMHTYGIQIVETSVLKVNRPINAFLMKHGYEPCMNYIHLQKELP